MASNDGRILAAIPILVGVLLADLVFPHKATPTDVPLPDVDEHQLASAERVDDARAQRATETTLPADVRALGEAIRRFNITEVKNPSDAAWAEIRTGVDDARRLALTKGTDAIADLRAAQLTRFMSELKTWRKAGKDSEELGAEGGAFIRRMTIEGWVQGNRLLPSDAVVRVMFKLRWNAVADARVIRGWRDAKCCAKV